MEKETKVMGVSVFDRAQSSARHIRETAQRDIDVAVVLGSGLGAFAEMLTDRLVIPYEDIPDFARSTVEGHGPPRHWTAPHR
jgi:purine-nucleoside phosphorylase